MVDGEEDCLVAARRKLPHKPTVNQIDLQGQNAVITGGARGIGYAIAERLLASGARCSLWDMNAAALKTAQKKLGAGKNVQTVVVELTNAAAVEKAAASSQRALGTIDILVNNAGIAGVSKKLWECSVEEWKQVVEVDLIGVFLCCRALVPGMLKKNYGRIVNISSVAGKEGNPNASHYSAAKAGVIALTKSLGKELAQTGIRVNCVTPAVIETEILQQVSKEHLKYMLSKIPLGRPGQSAEVAAMVAWLCSEECSYSTGAIFDITGGRSTH